MKIKKMCYFAIICMILFLFFYYIFNILGNNKNIKQSEIVDRILTKYNNYEALIKVCVISNKTETHYSMHQEVYNEKSKVEIEEPINIKGMTIEKNGTNLKIKNPNIDMEKIYLDYDMALNNSLFLNTFIKEFQNNDSKIIESDNKIIFKVKLNNNLNTYASYKELHLDKKTYQPLELLIKDNTQNIRISIVYNEIRIK